MKKTNNISQKSLWISCCFLLSFCFLSVFSYYTSPFCIIEGFDASFFRMVGMGMTKGYLPYRDFFDMKGPYLFFIQYLGQILCYGRIGLFIYQTISLTVSLIVLDKIIWFLTDHKSTLFRLSALLPYLCFLANTYCGGNITEEFSLPFLLLCMYLAMKYCYTMLEQPHPPFWAGIYGACFGIMAMIRITNAVTICVIVGCITIYLVLQRQFRNLAYNAGAFLLGFTISLIPALIYCAVNHILSDMVNQVFLFGYTYASEGGLIKLFFFNKDCVCYTPFLIYPLVCLVFSKRGALIRHLTLLHAVALLIVLSMGNSYPHYFLLMVPYLACGTALHVSNWTVLYLKLRKIVVCLALVCLLPLMLKSLYMFAPFAYKFIFNAQEYYDHYTDTEAKEIAAYIPEDDSSSVFTYGLGSDWYVETGLFPCIRYCDWQNHYIELSSEVRTDLKQILEDTPPKWIVTSQENEEWNPDFLNTLLEKRYRLYSENDRYRLWNLK